MKIELRLNEVCKNIRILVISTDRLPNDIHCDGKIHIDRICDEYETMGYKGQVGKVIAIEPLNNEFCAIMLAMEENEAGLENIGYGASAEELEAATRSKNAWTKTIQIDKPDRIYTNEQIIKSVKGELGSEHRNDTAAKDYFARLANRIEYYGLTDKDFADAHPYWRSYVAYIRHGDFPNPGIDRNTHEFATRLNSAIAILQDVKE